MNLMYFDLSRGSDIVTLIVVSVIALLGLILGCVVKVKNTNTGHNERSGIGGLEALLLVIVGALIARTFIWLLLIPLEKLELGAILVGHLFFLIPSIIDDFISLGTERILTRPDILLMMATIVGAFLAMMDGIWRIHNWKGLGWLSFPLDMTWGLAGNNYALLLHLINFAWGKHGTETRINAHRFSSGFALKSGFAFTQGSVMSSLPDLPGTPLFKHEKTHVWQNRTFGPFYSLSYILWMLVWLIPGVIAGAASKDASGATIGMGKGAERMCYFNCPWEVWGYNVQGQNRKHWGPELIWSDAPIVVIAILLFAALAALIIFLYIQTILL